MKPDTKKGPERFLFLEFLNPEINALLTGLRREFSGNKGSTDIHITVRGPYEGNIPKDEIAKCEETLNADPLLIHGVGTFNNTDEYIVYIKVISDNLKKIWWKPDYPINKYGFNPHITLYRGADREFAEDVRCFLDREGLRLLCHDFRLTPFSSRQQELFPFDSPPKSNQFLKLTNLRLVRPDILQRAANLVARFEQERNRDHAVLIR